MTTGATHFIFGEEPFLIEEAVQAVAISVPQFEVVAGAESITVSELFQVIATVSLFSSQKLIKLRNPGFLADTMSDTELAQFGELLKLVKQNGHLMIIYLVNKKLDQRKKIFGLLKKNAQVKEFLAFKDWEQDKVIEWVRSHSQKKGKKIEFEAAQALEEIAGGQLQILSGEIEKLITAVGSSPQITLSDVQALNAGKLASFYDLGQAMQVGDHAKVFQVVSRLMDQHEDPVKILGGLVANYRLYLQLLVLDAERKSGDDIGKLTGKNPFFVKRLIPPIKRAYTISQLKAAMVDSARTDLAIKSGAMKPKEALELLVLGRV